MKPLYIDGMRGLGDNIFSRPFVRAAAAMYDVYLGTPWPELFADLAPGSKSPGVKYVYRPECLRTQMKNIAAQPRARWTLPPSGAYTLKLRYDLAIGSIPQAFERLFSSLGIIADPFLFDLPDFGPSPLQSDRPITVLRPVTVRAEWRNEARNPQAGYLDAIAALLFDTHTIVSVADLADGREWLIPPAPRAHVTLHRGELSVTQLLALMQHADIVVGGVGFLVPAAIALKRRAFVVLGGNGGHNAPEKLTDPRMNLSRIGFAMPERFCRCRDKLHACDKTIPDLAAQFSAFAMRTGLRSSTASARAA